MRKWERDSRIWP